MIVGSQIGPYRIERMLSEGGMGVIYVGVHVDLERRAAIKQLLPELSRRRDIVKRFFGEAKATASIDHPGIVPICEVGWHADGSAYFAMKLLEGDTLAKRLRAGPMPLAMACTVAQQIASALDAAHAAGIVHRDLKPANIILVRDDAVKPLRERAIVLDFGIAKLTGDWLVSQKTRTGSSLGTAPYMSPEQHQSSGEVDHRTDVYAIGCTLFEMLTGRPPFVGANDYEVIKKLVLEELPTLRSLRPDVSPEFEALVMRCLAKHPDQRYQTMTELIAELESCPVPTDSANGAVLPEIGASPVAPAMSGPPTPLLRPRKLPEGEPPERDLADRGPPERELSERELSEREPPKRELPEQEFSGSEPPESEPLERQPVEQESVERVHVAVVVPVGERPPDNPVERDPVVHVAVQAPADERRPDEPVERGPVVHEVGSRGEVVVVAVVFARFTGPVPPMGAPGAAAGPPDAGLVIDAPPVMTVTDSAAQIPTMQDVDSSANHQLAATDQKTDEQQDFPGGTKGILGRDPDNARPKQPAERGKPGNGRGKDRGRPPIPRPAPDSDPANGSNESKPPRGPSTLPPQESATPPSGSPANGSDVSDRPKTLDTERNSAVLNKVKADVNNRCGGLSHATVSVWVHITVRPDGHVGRVTVNKKLNTALSNCIWNATQRAIFPPTQEGGSFDLYFEFVPSPRR